MLQLLTNLLHFFYSLPYYAEYAVTASSSAFVQPSPAAPAYSLPWAATANITTQPPIAAAKDERLPNSRLSPYFSHRTKNASSMLGRPRASSLSSNNSSSSNEKLAAPDVRRNVFSSMSASNVDFSGERSKEDKKGSSGTSILAPPITLRRISVQRKDQGATSSLASPSTTELALGLSNLTMTDEFELRRNRRISDGGSSTSSANGATIEKVPVVAAPALPTPPTTATTTPTSITADWRANFRVPMLSPDGKLVGYKQNSSMLRRQMQVSMPYSEADTATPPESPMFINNASSGSGSNFTTIQNKEDFLAASQDAFAGFPDAENQLHGYLLGPIVGRGGFSSVHKGLHVATSLPVAVKVIDKTRMRDPKDRDRVDREMRVMRQLSGHIGIAQLLECAETPQYLFIIMEYCAGGSLLDYVREKRKLSENEACLLFQQLLAALQHCHGRGVVHRDIKLENILLDGDHSGVKLIDFGLCGYYVPDKPLRCHCGSPSYAAPEIVARKDYLAGPVDVWSAGVVLFAMLAGYLPFQARDKKALSSKIIRATWTPPSGASSAAVDLLEKMLTLNPEERICLNKIWEHPWVAGGPQWEGNGEGPNGLMRSSAVDLEVAQAWVEILLGRDTIGENNYMATLLRALRLKECNATTAGYHLLCQAKNELYGEDDNYHTMESRSSRSSSGDCDESGESCVTAAATSSFSDLDIFI
jgi:5'-AMP-activated protein kinase, catalytic alpha subunit